MIVAVAATEFEMEPFRAAVRDGRCLTLVCGVGPVESGLQLALFLDSHRSRGIDAVVNFGVGGAYCRPGDEERPVKLGDICVARSEVLGDLGICFPRRIDDLPEQAAAPKFFELDASLARKASEILAKANLPVHWGRFVTVSCASGTRERGEMLKRRYKGLCENMEGGAIARVCREFGLPLMELRCISNYVLDRDTASWRLQPAAETSGRAAALVINTLGERPHS